MGFLEELETNAALNVVPVRAEDPDPDPEERSEEPGEDSQDGEESEDDEDKPKTAEELLRQHDRASLKEELKRLGHQHVTGSNHALAERPRRPRSPRWDWKIKGLLPPE